MQLTPREHDKLIVAQVGHLAQRRLARGVRLNRSEATALIASQLHELIRDGDHTVAQLMNEGKKMLGRKHVLPSVVAALHEIMVEGTFKDGTYLVTVHQPICSDDGNLEKALRGSFLPVPDASLFKLAEADEYKPINQPGAIRIRPGKIVLNAGKERTRIKITNTGDRPIQVGSHYHLVETNPALSFDRGLAYGKRLDVPAGTAVRFEPGDVKTVSCVEISGKKIITGGNNLASGQFDASRIPKLLEDCASRGFKHVAATA
ncbi:Urease [Taphrina deformans PYCC 5710]|uniref:Urease n=1 Tax=Taphrina deformans (strain PYCC 5710 / ATCC 11124 / CBS 356.35 / IMI 108563 / JCM 9778 / NBRC 8474) TaxID=1097556 RepID=R5A820_TAPDE|nr:Urease [Taphrina deformans PYCC 5710]|eukprot:CCX35434.1 Urease [Taphrina deformans PYCC 5710]